MKSHFQTIQIVKGWIWLENFEYGISQIWLKTAVFHHWVDLARTLPSFFSIACTQVVVGV